jgi:hypothetical protein
MSLSSGDLHGDLSFLGHYQSVVLTQATMETQLR